MKKHYDHGHGAQRDHNPTHFADKRKHNPMDYAPRRDTFHANQHPPRRDTSKTLIAGQTDKKTGHSALSNSDNDSQIHAPHGTGHPMGLKPAHECGYARPAHHADQFPKRK